MESLKKLLEEKKQTNNYKSAEPEQTQRIHANSYQKDLGLVDSPLEKRVGAPAGAIQKAKLADKRYSNLPTVSQLKAEDYFARRRRPIAQNPDLGGAIKTEEDQYGPSHSFSEEDQQNPLVGGTERAEEDTLQAIQDGAGQPPAKIANPRGQSGSSGVYRTTIGKSELWENRPQHQGGSIEAILQSTQAEEFGGIPRGAITRSEFDGRFIGGQGNLIKSFTKAVEVDRLAQLLEHYNFEQQEATSAYGVSETTYQHRDGRSVIIGQETDDTGEPIATSITVGDQGSIYPVNSIREIQDFVVLGKLPIAPKSVEIRRDLRNVTCETCGRRYLAGDNRTLCPYCAKSASKPGMSHTVIDSKWENQDEIGLGNVTRPQVEGRDKVTPSFAYTEFVQLPKKKADGHSLVKRQIERWNKAQ